MNIIVEGPDGSGKSTLVRFLAEKLNWPIAQSPTLGLTYSEFYVLVEQHLKINRMIFDRHRCVSEPIYGHCRGKVRVTMNQLQRFYGQTNLFIYSALLLPHVIKEDDTAEHIVMLEQKSREIEALYREWAFRCAHIIYRSDKDLTLKLIKGALS